MDKSISDYTRNFADDPKNTAVLASGTGKPSLQGKAPGTILGGKSHCAEKSGQKEKEKLFHTHKKKTTFRLSLVEMIRLERTTPTSRTWCASQLRYISIALKPGRLVVNA